MKLLAKEEEIEISKATSYVNKLFMEHQVPNLVYHNLAHTQNVVMHVIEIAQHENISLNNQYILIIAALFHDTGHLFSGMNGHESKSIEIMKSYLNANSFNIGFINQAIDCIKATQMPVHPLNKLQEIICDADTFHLGTPEFFVTDKLVRQEFLLREGIKDADWGKHSLIFLEKHTFFTSYCRTTLNPGKAENIRILRETLLKA